VSHAHAVTVHSGDTLSGIAAEHHVPGGWESLYAANQKLIGQNPDMIYPGKRFTIPAHKLTATAAFLNPHSYVVRDNDNLSAIAAKFKTPGGWDSIFADNPSVTNPNVLAAGMMLSLPDHAMFRSWNPPVAVPVATAPVAAAPVVHAPAKAAVASTAAVPVTHTQSAPAESYHGSSAMQECIISRESGGNPDVTNASGHYGLYQFSYSTWVGSGGSPATFGHASVAEQNQVFENAVAARGYSDWAPYDGC
jgi:LysM repeat protein